MFKKRELPETFSTFDIAFKPLFTRGKDGRKVSASYRLEQKLCQDAVSGKRKAVAVVLRMMRAQEAARLKQRTPWAMIPLTKRDRERRATPAMLLLTVASLAPSGASKGAASGRAITPVLLEPWVIDLLLSGEDAAKFTDWHFKKIQHCSRAPSDPAPAPFRLPPPGPAKTRSAEDTRYKKGQSGNPKGRPVKEKVDLPLGDYFDEIGTMRIDGKDVKVTRLQALLHHLNMKALAGDSCLTAVLSAKYFVERVERRKRGEHRHHDAPLADEYNLPPRLEGDQFEQMLRMFRITNPRTKTRVLLEPWIVEAALARFGDRRLTKEEQAEVLRSTSKPGSVNWPDWWEIRSHADAKPYIPVQPRFRREKVRSWNFRY